MAAVLGSSLEVESEQEFEQAMALPTSLEGEWNPYRGFGRVRFASVAAAQEAYRNF